MDQEKSDLCCPKFIPEPWDDKELFWDNKRFVKRNVKTLFYMPLNYGSVMKDVSEKIEKAETIVPDYLCLSKHPSKWSMELLVAVGKEVSGEENVSISGKYYSKVYEGNFKDTGKWMSDFSDFTKNKGLEIEDVYMWYTTCPKCAKKFGKNYVVLIGKIK